MANEANDEMCCTQSALQFINIHVLWSYKPLLSVLQARTRYLVHGNNELQQKVVQPILDQVDWLLCQH